ncbi:hypothetical protein RN001_002383 [Aquatica leii]|uniref:DUF6589 domain-containing protein n=1 Tax=Aquatica leii TaxID=1421715 RepID=A0AAN7SK42_9COLE|nr:hypothetical protein RN001_002383 [Aquatica leii]
MALKSLTSSKKIINILNRFGHCCNYTTLEELETISFVHQTQVCSPYIILNPLLCTGVASFDRYVDTLNGKETLHDTVGIIYQNIDDNSHSGLNQDDDTNAENMLPPPRLKMVDRLTPVQIDHPSPPENFSLLQAIDLLHLLSHVFHIPNTPSWTGFNCRIIEDNSPKQKVSYLTQINLSPTNVSVVAYTMEQAQNVGKECGQTYVQVTYGLPIAKIALKIQATEGLKLSNLFIHLGWFHFMMVFFKAVGTFINECGLSHMMIESKIIASGSANGIIEGKHFNRCNRLYPLMSLGLQMLHFDQFLKTKNVEHSFVKGQIYEELLEYQDKKNHNRQRLQICYQMKLISYQQNIAKTRQGDHGKTAQFYMIYIQLISYYINLSRSIRKGEFQMFKSVIPKMANLFFIVNQPNYARYCVKYLDNLNNVDETHPGLEDDFNNGFFGVKRTDKPFSRAPIDLTLEQTINADAARRLSGITHFTNSIAARQPLPCFHAITGCDYTPAFFRKDKVRPFKVLEKSKEYQSAFGNVTTDDKELLESTFVTLEKFICQIYSVNNFICFQVLFSQKKPMKTLKKIQKC